MRAVVMIVAAILLVPTAAYAGGRGQTDSDGNVSAEADAPGRRGDSGPATTESGVGSSGVSVRQPRCTDTHAALECATLDPVTQPQDAEEPEIDVPTLARRAADRTALSAPRIRLSPVSPNPSVVGLKTWFWLDGGEWDKVRARADAGDAKVTTTATPVSVTWQTGEGQVVCAGPGQPWRAGIGRSADTDCGYTFRHAAARQNITVSVSYSVAWKCVGEECDDQTAGDLGVIASPTAATSVRVVERQAVVVR